MYTIVRIEHTDGFGMFRLPEDKNGEYILRYQVGDTKETYDMYHRHYRRNTPTQDGIDLHDDMFCAFDSFETFNALVEPKEVQFLLTKGFKVYMLDVKEIAKGSHQVCFRKEDIITKKDISSLFLIN